MVAWRGCDICACLRLCSVGLILLERWPALASSVFSTTPPPGLAPTVACQGLASDHQIPKPLDQTLQLIRFLFPGRSITDTTLFGTVDKALRRSNNLTQTFIGLCHQIAVSIHRPFSRSADGNNLFLQARDMRHTTAAPVILPSCGRMPLRRLIASVVCNRDQLLIGF